MDRTRLLGCTPHSEGSCEVSVSKTGSDRRASWDFGTSECVASRFQRFNFGKILKGFGVAFSPRIVPFQESIAFLDRHGGAICQIQFGRKYHNPHEENTLQKLCVISPSFLAEQVEMVEC